METVEMAGITRINFLYNNTKGRPGRFGISRSTFFDNFVLHSEDDPYIPRTNVRRLRLLHLAPNACAAFNDEIDALEEGLKRWRDKVAEQRNAIKSQRNGTSASRERTAPRWARRSTSSPGR
jgi:hypothetical protein